MYPKIIYVTDDIFLFCLSCSVFVVIVASLLVAFVATPTQQAFPIELSLLFSALVPTFSSNSRRNKLATYATQTAKSSFKFFFFQRHIHRLFKQRSQHLLALSHQRTPHPPQKNKTKQNKKKTINNFHKKSFT